MLQLWKCIFRRIDSRNGLGIEHLLVQNSTGYIYSIFNGVAIKWRQLQLDVARYLSLGMIKFY
jgi:hypothetical protein